MKPTGFYHRMKVASARSSSSRAKLERLNWKEFSLCIKPDVHYLSVRGKRSPHAAHVFCRHHPKPGISFTDGCLYWIFVY